MGKADGCLKGVGFSRPAALGYIAHDFAERRRLPRALAFRGRHFQRTLSSYFSGNCLTELSTQRNVRWQLLEAKQKFAGLAGDARNDRAVG